MTDQSNQIERRAKDVGGITIGTIALGLALQLNPILIKALETKYPLLGDTLCTQIVAWAETGLGTIYMTFTLKHFVQKIVSGILLIRAAGQAIAQAWYCKDVPPIDETEGKKDA